MNKESRSFKCVDFKVVKKVGWGTLLKRKPCRIKYWIRCLILNEHREELVRKIDYELYTYQEFGDLREKELCRCMDCGRETITVWVWAV